MNSIQKILVVDDTGANLVAMGRVLEGLDVEIVCVHSGNEALTATLYNDFAAAVIDVQMPEMDGYELAEILRSDERTRALPILFVSAVYSEDAHVFRGYEAGAVDFLIKPIQKDILINKLKFFLLLDSQRKELRRHLEIAESESFLRTILRSLSDAVVVVDEAMNISLVNSHAATMFGRDDATLIGAPLGPLFAGGDPPLEHPCHAVEREIHVAPGQSMPVRITSSKLEGRGGLVIVVTDITQETLALRVEEDLRVQLAHSQRLESLGRLAGGVAHDLNNLLTIIQMCTGVAIEDADDPSAVRFELEQSLDAARKGESLVRELLAIGRKQVLAFQTVDLHQALTESCTLLSRLLGDNVVIQQDYADDTVFVELDKDQFSQVIMNLAVNARDAMPDGGTLAITTSLSRDTSTGRESVVIRLSDTGVGMDETLANRAFEPFFTTKDRESGTGLGLAMVHGIITQSKGEISVESTPGVGTTFTIVFDRTSAPNNSERLTDTASLPTRAGSVLLVEDDVSVRRTLVGALTRSGFQVTVAGSLGETMRALETRDDFSVLVSDVHLPEDSGLDIAAAVRERLPALPVMFISGNPGDLLDAFGDAPANVSFLQKPFVPKTFVAKVASACQGRSGSPEH